MAIAGRPGRESGGSAVVDAERVRSAADINAEREPRERLLEDALTAVASKEQAVRAGVNERGEKPQFGDSDILRLIDHGKIEWPPTSGGDAFGDPPEQVSPGHGTAFGKSCAHPIEDGPKDLALRAADPGLAAEPGDVAVLLPSSYLPGIDNLPPLAGQKPRCEMMPRDFGRGLPQQRVDQSRRGQVGLAQCGRIQLVADAGDRMHGDTLADVGLVPEQVSQPRLERIGERLRERGQQHLRLPVAPRQRDGTV